MKRFAVVFAALALTGAMAFADDAAPAAKVSGYLNTGVQIVNSSAGTTYQSHGADFGIDGYVGKLGASIGGDTWGLSGTIDLKQVGGVTVDGYTAWVSPLEGVKLFGGTDYDGSVNGVDDVGSSIWNAGGLGAAYAMGPLAVGLTATAYAPHAGNGANLAFGARYTLDKVITINANGGTGTAKGLDWYGLTASLTAVPSLTLKAGVNSSAVSTAAVTNADAVVGYAVTEALSVTVTVYDNDLTGTSAFTYKPAVSYTVSPMVALSAYYLGGTASGYAPEAQAEVTYTINGNAHINGIYTLDMPSSGNTHKVNLDFVYSF